MLFSGPLIFGSLYLFSYAVLAWLGVKENRSYRAFIFSMIITAIQVIPFTILGVLLGQFGLLLGALIGWFFSYQYVRKVLKVNWLQNLSLIVLLPILSAGTVALTLLTIFGAMSNA